ncbi:MAG: CBS domain-containing protein [Puniceicoccaceae bacterium]
MVKAQVELDGVYVARLLDFEHARWLVVRMNTVRNILDQKIPHVSITISPDKTTFEALELMDKHDVGAILVMENNKLVGLFTERDYSRKVILMGRASRETPVRDTMLDKLLVVPPSMSVEDCMKLMTEKRIRYLPVMEEDRFIGIVSIGDVLKSVLNAQAQSINHLERYITGGDYGV